MKGTILFVAAILLVFEKNLHGQELFRMNNVPVYHGSKQILNPFTGGMNSCIINQMDLNKDGIKDLVVVHQVGVSAGRIQPFIQKPNGSYVYAPRYEAFFPKEGSYVFLLHDLDEDSTEDLIIQTQSYFFIHYCKRTNDSTFQFDFYDSIEYTSYDPLYGRTQLIALNKYLPMFEDLDGDGDVDFVYVSRSFNHLRYYKNYKKEMTLPSKENFWKGDNKFYGQACFADFNPLKFKSGCHPNMEKFLPPPKKDPILTPRHDEFQMIWNIDIDGNKLYDAFAYSENQKNSPLGLNIGTKDSAYLKQGDDFRFPSYSSRPIDLMMPIGFWYDVNNDKAKDILVSFLIERDFSGVQLSQKLFNDDVKTIHQYRNLGKRKKLDLTTNTYHDSFAFINDDFLADETIDVGTGSAPVFYNYDKDSLIDLLIPNIMKRDSWEIGYITYYRNIGNKKQPLYKLESNDLFSYKSKNRANIKIAVGDLNGDKIDDILITSFDRNLSGPFASNGSLPIIGEMYFHKGGSGGFLYTTQNLSLEYEDKYGRSNICFHDVDKDGKVDMFMGDLFHLKYYKNISKDSIVKFSKPSCDSVINPENLLDPINLPFQFIYHPAVWTDPNDSKDYLIFAYNLYGGKVGKALIDTQKLNNNRSLILKNEHKSLYPNFSINHSPTIAIKDVTDDGKAEIIFGNYAGGVQMFSIDSLTGVKDPPPPPVSISSVKHPLDFTIYPNPSSDKIYFSGLDASKRYSLYIYTIEGKLIQQHDNSLNLEFIDISTLNHGIYWLNIVNEELGNKTIKIQKH